MHNVVIHIYKRVNQFYPPNTPDEASNVSVCMSRCENSGLKVYVQHGTILVRVFWGLLSSG